MSCPASVILRGVQLNANGIQRLQKNKAWDSIQTFSEALRSVVASLHGGADGDHDKNEEPPEMSVDKESDIPSLQNMVVSIDLSHCNDVYTDANDDADFRFAVYNRALHVSFGSATSWPQSKIPYVYCHLLCGVLLYNIGLAHHIVALEDQNREILGKALDFYSIAHRTLPVEDPPQLPRERGVDGNQEQDQEEPSHELSNLAFLAVANNVGQLHAVSFEHSKAAICSDEVFQRLAFVLENPPTDETAEEEEQKEDSFVPYDKGNKYRDFMLNASLFSSFNRMPAPAA